MKTISMTEFRKQPGEVLLDVIRERASFLITKAGKPVARLLPIDDSVTVERDGRVRGEVLPGLQRLRKATP